MSKLHTIDGNAKTGAQLTIDVTPELLAWLAQLARTGVHGRSLSEVAERILCAHIVAELESGGWLTTPT